MAHRVGSYGYVFEFPVEGMSSLEDRTLRVIFIRPDGSGFERTSETEEEAPADVQILAGSTVKEARIGVQIKEGDWNQTGEYKYELRDETDGVFKSDVRYVYIGEGLELPEAPAP